MAGNASPEGDRLKHRTARGLLWGAIGSGGLQILNLVFGIYLSRILSQVDYGIIGSLTIFSAIAGILTESGFILAIANRREATDDDYNAVFWFNIVIGSALYTLLYFLAPAIGRFYHQPEMVSVARFLFLSFLVGGFAAAPTAYFFRNLMVRERTHIQLLAIIISGSVGVTCAYRGLGYWSLAIQTVLYSGLNSLMIWLRCPWRPRFSFRLSSLRAMLPFSMRQLLTSVFVQINNNIFSVILGRFYGMSVTGFYTQGNKWTTMGYSTVSGMLNSVAMPVFGQVVDDHERMRRIFLKMESFTCFISFPALLGLGLVAPEVITIAVTAKWLPAVPVMQILCVWGAFMPLSTLYGGLINSLSRPDVYMWTTITLGAIQIATVCLTYHLGLDVMLMIYSGINILWLGVWQYHARRIIGLSTRAVVKAAVPFLSVAAGAIALAAFAASLLPPAEGIAGCWLSLGVKIAVAAGAYILVMWRLNAPIFRETLTYLRRRNPAD